MNTLIKRLTGIAIASLAILAFLYFFGSQLNNSTSANANPYPEPEEYKGVVSTTSPEDFCAQWFMLSTDIPLEKRRAEEENYQRCVETRKTPPFPLSEKTAPSLKNEPPVVANIPRREAGDGVIVETSLAPFPSYYAFYNQWYMESNNQILRVFAGTQKSDGVKTLDKPWRGLLAIMVTSTDKKRTYPDEGGFYWTPTNSGPVRIIDADGTELILLAENGDIFVFDVINREFLTSKTMLTYGRKAGDGVIVEDKTVQVGLEKAGITNQWYIEKENTRISALAGQDIASREGLLIVITESLDQREIYSEEIYRTPIGPLRIFDVEASRITLIAGDNVFVFDMTSKKFVIWPDIPPDFDPKNNIVIPVEITSTLADNERKSTPSATPMPYP